MSIAEEDALMHEPSSDVPSLSRKFGKHIQKRQLDIPEYAASFVDYKALKKLIKKLSATPIIAPQPGGHEVQSWDSLDPQAALQANKATFFFRLERELEKVNIFYLQKEAELKLRLTTLLDKKLAMQTRGLSASRLSSKYLALDEGFRQFSSDLDKLQQFVEVNATAFSKILKKWDKTSKSRTKELYLSRAVEVQPCFNRDVISSLSDQATTSLLELAAWAEGEKIQYTTNHNDQPMTLDAPQDNDVDIDHQTLQSIVAGNIAAIDEWTRRIRALPDAQDRVTKAFLSTVDDAPEVSLRMLLNTNLVDLLQEDEINERNCLHKAAISGRKIVLDAGLHSRVDVRTLDVYGRIPLHYACMHGHVDLIDDLVSAAPDSINAKDQDGFTPLIHGIIHSQLACVEKVLSLSAQIDPTGASDHIPLNLACQHGSQEIVQLLLQRQPKVLPDAEGLYPQHLVARSGKLPQLLLLLKEYGADLDQPDKLYQWTPLFHAASEGHVECLKVLLENGVSVDIVDEKGLHAMYYATWEGHLECMQVLAAVTHPAATQARATQVSPQMLGALPPPISSTAPIPMEADGIPDLSLPPPIIPLRRYGHNFLDSKTFVVINFGGPNTSPVEFFDNHKYPAARLTVSSKSTDLIPRNVLLPMQEEFKIISFQIDNLDTFTIEFDIYPTFGSKVIAHAAALSKRFSSKSSSSEQVCLEMFDPRLRVIGCINFRFQIVKPFHGIPLEITHFATYWKATSQIDSHPSALITGSSLSGQYVRLFVQLTADGIPVLFPQWTIHYNDLEVAISNLTYEEFAKVGTRLQGGHGIPSDLSSLDLTDMPSLHQLLATSFSTLEETLAIMPPQIHVEIHILYPKPLEERELRLGSLATINDFADSLLKVVFDHARHLRDIGDNIRSIVFSSFNQDICTAINWKQPNYPVLLSNELGSDPTLAAVDPKRVQYSGRITTSVKEAVQIAQNNNFMGLICSSRLLDLAPSLIDAIKTAGLVLVTDLSDVTNVDTPFPVAGPSSQLVPEGVDGFLKGNGVLKFNETIDM